MKNSIDFIESELIILLENRNISQKLFNCIVPNQSNKLGKARILPKINKDKFYIIIFIIYNNILREWFIVIVLWLFYIYVLYL